MAFSTGDHTTLPKQLPTPSELRSRPDLIRQLYRGITVSRQSSLFQTQDSPTKSIYRMCDFLCVDESNQLMLEMQYFWDRSTWTLESIPDPQENNPERYAMLASLVESLVIAFNARSALGLRRGQLSTEDGLTRQEICPWWCAHVPRLADHLILYEDEFSMGPGNNPFSKRNIAANAGNLFSI